MIAVVLVFRSLAFEKLSLVEFGCPFKDVAPDEKEVWDRNTGSVLCCWS